MPPASTPRRLWAAVFIAVMVLACVVAGVATALYLSGAYLAP
jgi:hypothetical protein